MRKPEAKSNKDTNLHFNSLFVTGQLMYKERLDNLNWIWTGLTWLCLPSLGIKGMNDYFQKVNTIQLPLTQFEVFGNTKNHSFISTMILVWTLPQCYLPKSTALSIMIYSAWYRSLEKFWISLSKCCFPYLLKFI